MSNPYMMFILVLLLFIVYANYSARKLKNQILCSFNRRDRTKVVKLANQKQSVIEFDGGWYDIDPACTVLRLWDSGIHYFLPIWVRCSDYRYDSSKPLNPETFNNQYTPEDRARLDAKDDISAFNEGNRSALAGKAGKQGMLQQYLPLIMLIGFMLVGWMLWQITQKLDMYGLGQNTLEIQMGEIMKRLPK